MNPRTKPAASSRKPETAKSTSSSTVAGKLEVVKGDALSKDEAERLAQCESVIERGKETFVEVGLALSYIQAHRLYRQTHQTFQAYCEKRWGFSRFRAYQLIQAAGVVKMLTNVNTVTNEAQARELAKVPEKKRAGVLNKVRKAGKGKVTAAGIRKVAGTAKAHDPTKGRITKVPLQPEPSDQSEFTMQDAVRQKVSNGAAAPQENSFIANVKRMWPSIPMEQRKSFVEWIFEVTPELRPLKNRVKPAECDS